MNGLGLFAWVVIICSLIGIAVLIWLSVEDARHKKRLKKMREETDAKRQRNSDTPDLRPEKRTDFLP